MTSTHSKLSVAMAVYNGERYMRAQLDSIAAQVRPPDELVICDDASTDSSTEIARDFAANASFPVHIHCNEVNLGACKTFERAIGACSGDIISLCDFDDVWYPRKLEMAERALLDSPEAGMVACDADLVDDELRPLGSTLWRAVGLNARERKRIRAGEEFEVIVRRGLPIGSNGAFSATFKPAVLPMPKGEYFRSNGVDSWIGLLVLSCGARLKIIDEPLLAYRQHVGQYSGGVAGMIHWHCRISGAARARRNFDTTLEEAVLARLEHEPQPEARAAVALLQTRLRHFSVRRSLPEVRVSRIPIVMRELVRGAYHRHSHGLTSVAKDLALS